MIDLEFYEEMKDRGFKRSSESDQDIRTTIGVSTIKRGNKTRCARAERCDFTILSSALLHPEDYIIRASNSTRRENDSET